MSGRGLDGVRGAVVSLVVVLVVAIGLPAGGAGCGSSSSPAPDGKLGDAGPDVGKDCSKIVCTKPPAPRCIDAKKLLRYAFVGTCQDGLCSYDEQQETCAGGCLAGACWKSTTFLHVDARNAGAELGTARAPFRSISQALAKAQNGTGILVAAGDYPGNLTVQGQTLELVGGYAGASASDYAGGKGGDFVTRDVAAHRTTITASGEGPGLSLVESGTSLVAGFTITGGGRGVYCEGGAPTLRANRVTGNQAPSLSGAGIFAKDCDLTLLENLIDDNIGSRGGGVGSEGGKLLFLGNLIKNNEGRDDHGGGFYLTGGDVQLRDNRWEGNKVGVTVGYGWGGGGALIDCKAELSGNVSTGNLAKTFGGGLFVDEGSVATLRNELYYGNLCGDGGAGLFIDGLDLTTRTRATLINVTIADHPCGGLGNGVLVEKSDVTIRSSIFWNNGDDEFVTVDSTLALTYSRTSTAQAGAGNTSGDPLFAGSGGAAYHLSSKTGRWDGAQWVQDGQSSPAIDGGDPQDGVGDEPAPNGGRANLGAFGRTPTASKSP